MMKNKRYASAYACALAVVVALLLLVRVEGQNRDVTVKKWPLTFGEIMWCNASIALMNAEEGLWRSTNEGQDWKMVDLGGRNSVFAMQQDTVNPMMVLLVGTPDAIAWTSPDCGQTVKQVSFPYNRAEFIPHPYKSGWMCISVPNGIQSTIYVTRDFAQTWTKVADTRALSPVVWGNDPSAPNNIFLITADSDFEYTSNFGGSWTKIFSGAYAFALTSHHLFVVVADPKKWDEYNLMVSSGQYTEPKTYFESQFPFGEDLPQSYTLLDDSTGAEWLGIVMDSFFSGTMYTSGSDGLKYTTTLDNVYQQNGLFDFDVFHGLEGIYITNIVSNPSNTGGSLQTRITFDNGATWQSLAAPKYTWDKRPISCTGSCGLHLHGVNDWQSRYTPPYYSSPNAIGLLIGTGNYGTYLESVPKSTYLSRDAGRTWTEILGGSYIYEMGDHGGILVFAYLSTPTNQVFYSLDEGLTIQSFYLDQLVDVFNVIAEPSGTGRKFVLYGVVDNGDAGVVYGLDFSSAQNRTCTDDDYESWTPRANMEACLLGRNVTYTRRIQTRNCFNSRDTEHANEPVNCDCTMDDYECDFGYVEQPNVNLFVCTLGDGVSPQSDPPPYCPAGTTYTVSKGYRRVAGDTCVHSMGEYEPVVKTCPKNGGSGGHGGVVAAVVIIILVAFGVAGFLIYRNDEWRETAVGIIGKVIPISSGTGSSSRYSRLGGVRPGSLADEEFGIGGEHDLDDSDVEEDAPELQDNDIIQATSLDRNNDDFNPRG